MVVNRSHADTWKVQAETLMGRRGENVKKSVFPGRICYDEPCIKISFRDVEYEEGDLLFRKEKRL